VYGHRYSFDGSDVLAGEPRSISARPERASFRREAGFNPVSLAHSPAQLMKILATRENRAVSSLVGPPRASFRL
jgi:hypothetical protein